LENVNEQNHWRHDSINCCYEDDQTSDVLEPCIVEVGVDSGKQIAENWDRNLQRCYQVHKAIVIEEDEEDEDDNEETSS